MQRVPKTPLCFEFSRQSNSVLGPSGSQLSVSTLAQLGLPNSVFYYLVHPGDPEEVEAVLRDALRQTRT